MVPQRRSARKARATSDASSPPSLVVSEEESSSSYDDDDLLGIKTSSLVPRRAGRSPASVSASRPHKLPSKRRLFLPSSLALWLYVTAGLLGTGCYYYSSRRSLRAQPQSVALFLPPLETNDKVGGTAKHEPEEGGRWEEKECTVWIAPTSLRGVNGYGIFTTRDLEEGESILGSPDGVAIPVEAYRAKGRPNYESFRKFRRLFDNYWWGRGVPDHVIYEAPPDVVDYQIGFGCLPNHHCVLSYLSTEYPNPPYDDTLANRFEQPSAGAFSYNRGREFTVSHAMKAGEEIFLNYGWCTRDKDSPSWTSNIFVTSDFETAARIVSSQHTTKSSRQFQRYSRSKSQSVWGGDVVFRHMVRNTSFYDGEDLLLPADLNLPEQVQRLLPPKRRDLENVLAKVELVEDDEKDDELVRQLAFSSLNRKKVEEIRSHGMCMDNLLARTSTLPLAGQGGFAQRTVRAGELVAPAPLLQIMDRDALTLYDDDGNPNGTQLILNYCFGHSQSTLLLCPNTNAVLINHCSDRTRECGPRGPNAEYRWATGWDPSSDAWRKMSFQELAAQEVRGLAFEIVALRDIRPGEEVFIDYGPEWEHAWSKHVEQWMPASLPERWLSQKQWVSAKEANEDMGPVLDELISGDLRETVRHPYLFTGCQYWETDQDVHSVYTQPRDWQDMTDEEIMDRYSDPGERFCDGYHRLYRYHRDASHWPCTVLKHHAEDDTYTVRIHRAPWASDDPADLPWDANGLPRLLRNFKRDSIHYFVQPFASDQHLKGVFRHDIRIRDELFPEQWKNLAVRVE